MNNAIEAYRSHIAEVVSLNEQITQINTRIHEIQSIANEAVAPIQQAAELKAKRRSILARIFLGTGDKSDLPETEKAIAAAEAAANNKAPIREGAEAAIEELERQARTIQFKVHEVDQDRVVLLHAALIEHAKQAVPAYQEATRNLAKAYAELIGRCRAADDMALFQEGLYPTALAFPNAIEVPHHPTFGGWLSRSLIDVHDDVIQANGKARQYIDQIAHDAAPTINN